MRNSRVWETDYMVGEKIISSPWFESFLKFIVIALLPWAIWTTTNIYDFVAFIDRGDRFTNVDALNMEAKIKANIHRAEVRLDTRIDRLPPTEWRKQIRQALEEARRVEKLIFEFERTFTKDFIRKDELPLYCKEREPEKT